MNCSQLVLVQAIVAGRFRLNQLTHRLGDFLPKMEIEHVSGRISSIGALACGQFWLHWMEFDYLVGGAPYFDV